MILANSILSTDQFGNSASGFKSNAGDQVVLTFDIFENIYFKSDDTQRVTSSTAQLALSKVTFPSYFHLHGYSVGQNVRIECQKPSANESVTTTITSIDYNTLEIGFAAFFTAPFQFNVYDNNNQFFITCLDTRKDLYLNLNFTPDTLDSLYDFGCSNSIGAYVSAAEAYRQSQIDGNKTRFYYNMDAVAVSSSINMVQQGKLSGSFSCTVSVTRNTDTTVLGNFYAHNYTVEITLISPACIFDSAIDWLNSNFYFDLEWYSRNGILQNPTVTQWNLKPSESGQFDEAFRTETPNSTLTTAVTNPIYYDEATTHTVVFESTSADISMGAVYNSATDTYFKDKYVSQNTPTMLLITFGALSAGVYLCDANPVGAEYEIEVLSLSYVGTTHTVELEFGNMNQEFIDFMYALNPSDRKMNIWFTVGNVNHLVFSDNLQQKPVPVVNFTTYTPIGAPSLGKIKTDSPNKRYLTDGGSVELPFCSVGDDLMLEIQAQLQKNHTYKAVTYQVICAEIADTTNYFELESLRLDLSTSVYNSTTGITNFVVSVPKSDNLPTTSGLSNATVSRVSIYPDALTTFGATFKFPFLIDWRQWIEEPNAFDLFDPNKTRNYFNYSDGTYVIFVRVLLEADDKNIEYFAQISRILDFDEIFTDLPTAEEWNGTASIKYFDESANEQSVLVDGQIMTVELTVNTVQPIPLGGDFWGQATIEPFQNSPRYTLSSNYVYDANPNNPLIPLSGETELKATRVSATQAKFEFQIDTDKLSGSIDQTLTFKFMNPAVAYTEQVRLKFETKVLSLEVLSVSLGDEVEDCKDIFIQFASTLLADNDKNDFSCAWIPIIGAGDSVVFNLYDSNGLLTAFQPNTLVFPNQSNAYYAFWSWQLLILTSGAGEYTLKYTYTPAIGSLVTKTWRKYRLIEWDRDVIERYVRILTRFNDYRVSEKINFLGSGISDTLNVPGQFGFLDPKLKVDNYITFNDNIEKIKHENFNEYELVTIPLTSPMRSAIIKQHLLSGTNVQIWDYNTLNHDKYSGIKLMVAGMDKPEYLPISKVAKLTIRFTDKKLDQIGRYGG